MSDTNIKKINLLIESMTKLKVNVQQNTEELKKINDREADKALINKIANEGKWRKVENPTESQRYPLIVIHDYRNKLNIF